MAVYDERIPLHLRPRLTEDMIATIEEVTTMARSLKTKRRSRINQKWFPARRRKLSFRPPPIWELAD
jgi:hypothetical protein